MKRLVISAITLFAAVFAKAADGDISFEVSAPTVVEAGELFRVEFVINAAKDVEFTEPAIEGIEVMAGPQESRSTNIELDNGDFTRTEVTTYTYVLQAFTEGIHTIPAALVTVRGKSYSTRPVKIEVVGQGSSGGSGSSGNGQSGSGSGQEGTGRDGSSSGEAGAAQNDGSAPRITADDIFVRATVNHAEVYKGEPVVVTLKLYSRVPFMLDDMKPPAFNGFWQQDISEKAVERRETYNDRVYNTWTLKEYLLYPQQAGRMSVESFAADVTVRFQVRSSPRDIFDQMMGGGGFQDVRKKLTTQPIRIDVREWPGGAPESFGGAVGRFDMQATPPQGGMNANTSGSYVLRLEGTGNFPLVRAPELTLPESFEKYNVTTSDNTRHTRSGTTGYREFSYPFIPRTDGTYSVPAVEFSYLDPRQGRYVTLSSREMTIEVAADSTAIATSAGGMVSGLSREELKVFGQDIRFIKRGDPDLRPKGRMLLLSPLYLSLIVGLAVLFGVGYVLLGRFVRNMQSNKFVRSKRANKMALRRFRAAAAAMKQDDRHGFWGEMLKAMWGYMSDKLDIPTADLTKERIREELFERNIPEAQVGEYVRIISECEEAQYSPSSSARMGELYRSGVALVSELESAIKKI